MHRITRRIAHAPGALSVRHASTSSGARRSTRQLLQDLDHLAQRHLALDDAWQQRIRHALADLERSRWANVSIVGDRSAGVDKVTSAILDDPLSNQNPQDVTVALEARTLSPASPEARTIEFGPEIETTETRLTLPAKWLDDNKTQVTEIVHGDSPLESSFSTLHLSDAVIVLVSSTTLLSSRSAQNLLLDLHTKPNLIVCVNTLDASPAASASILDSLQHQLDTLFPSSTSTASPRVMAVSSAQALEALSALTPTTSEAGGDREQAPSYEDFQRGYLASQLPRLKTALSEILAPDGSTPSKLQEQTAAYVLDSALSRAAFSAASHQDALESAQSALVALSQQTSETSRRLVNQTLGVDPATEMFPLPSQELIEARQAIEHVFATRLQFYKLPFNKIDDISSELSLAISQTYLTRFEKHLLYSTGLFSAHASQLTSLLDQVVSKPPFSADHALHSAILENEVSKSRHDHPSSPTSIPATALSTPIATRRAQLLASPISTLHRRAQSALTSSLTLSTASVASAVGLHLVHAVEVANCVGFGALASTLSVWMFQGRWNRAKKKFWREFERVGGGVSEDLGVVTKQLIERCEYPTRLAVKGYEAKIRERLVGVTELKEGLRAIAHERRPSTATAEQVEGP